MANIKTSYALRNMRYWSNSDVVLLVLDASPRPIENNLLKILEKIFYMFMTKVINERIINSF